MSICIKFLGRHWYFYMILLFGCTTNKSPDSSGWKVYSADPEGTKYSELEQINRNNVSELQLAWTYACGDARPSPASTIECNPIVVNGTLFLTTPGLKLVALDAGTGTEKWVFDPFAGGSPSGVNRGVTYWSNGDEERIFYVAGSRLYSIVGSKGLPDTLFGDQGSISLYAGLGREVQHLWVTAATPGIIYEDLLIMGTTLGEGPAEAAPGHIRAYDVRTGEQRWIFHTIPHPGEPGYETWPPDAWTRVGGVNAWGGFTLDVTRGWAYCGTGSATYDHWGGNRIGANLYANCILALDARSGALQWHYQTVHHDIWDYDIPCPPNLVQVEKDGRLIDAVAQPTKMGHLFVLDRNDGTPIYPVEEVPVPQSQIPGEESWPTQPFPIESLRYAEQRFTHAEATTIDAEATAAIRQRLDSLDTGDIFLPPSRRGAVTLPQFNGGTDWGGAAYDPEKRRLFVNASNEAEWISMVPATPPDQVSQYDLGRQVYGANCAACHGYGSAARNPGSPSLQQLRGRQPALSSVEITDLLANGRGQMPRFATFSEDEKAAVIAFVLDQGRDLILNRDELKLSFSEDIPWVATGHNEFKDPRGFPANAPPWGTLSAIDLDAGGIKWQVPLGTYPQLEAEGHPPTGTFNMGGPIVTAGGLVFIGATMDERFRAFDADTGEELWSFQMDAGGYATPATFAIAGRQYVIIAAGGGGKPGTRAGDKYYCFTVPGM